MDPDPPLCLLGTFNFIYLQVNFWTLGFTALFLLLLLVCSALVSGSEVAYFSLSPNDEDNLKKEDLPQNKRILKLKKRPRKLLATILIANNFINIAIVILSDYMIRSMLGDALLLSMGESIAQVIPADPYLIGRILNFLITVLGVTFLLVLFGEVAPKIYANLNNLRFAQFMSRPMSFLSSFFAPVSTVLVRLSTKMESSVISAKTGIDDTSKEELDKAIQLTVEGNAEASEEADLLRGIIKFGNVSAKQVMRSRVDVVALDETVDFTEIMRTIKDSGYSRIPIFKEDFDEVSGILYAKDLLGFSKEKSDFDWQKFVRGNVLYVPESKKIDDILKEFQKQRLHMAIVVDEFGGSAGIITLEDILEEVIGEIKDEFDEAEEVDYVKINDSNFIFEGKTLLHDVARIINVDKESFDKYRNESDSIAGVFLNNLGHIPKKDKEITLGDFKLKIVSVTKRRIEKIHLTLL